MIRKISFAAVNAVVTHTLNPPSSSLSFSLALAVVLKSESLHREFRDRRKHNELATKDDRRKATRETEKEDERVSFEAVRE